MGGVNAVEVTNVSKQYGDFRAVDDLSFTVAPGQIFGLLGPNGAGKTTTIRILMDIIKPDGGRIRILGESLSAGVKNRIGYLPEERGLYRGLKVLDTLMYLSALKSMNRHTAEERAEILLRRFGLWDSRADKISALSKGMQQKIQFITTVLHNPDLVVLDEPFQGLDPVNTELIQEIIAELAGQGKTVILSTHMMSQVERLCDRIMLLNRGHSILYGGLDEVKARFTNNAVVLRAAGDLNGLVGVTHVEDYGRYQELALADGVTPQGILQQLVCAGVEIREFEVATPSLNDIFIEVIGSKEGC